jgi:hypothetical protein
MGNGVKRVLTTSGMIQIHQKPGNAKSGAGCEDINQDGKDELITQVITGTFVDMKRILLLK